MLVINIYISYIDIEEGDILNRLKEARKAKGLTQMEVAQEIGISQAQVSRLEKHALKNMRTYLRS